jgi:3-hydroxyacyl-[acyl-carrier-protein] dehydratase
VNYNLIIDKLPYSKPFLFVDSLESVDENGVVGSYRFPEDAFYYKGHFKDNPVTPGVILTECMAQIGVVSLGIYLSKDKLKNDLQIGMSSTAIDFYKPVFPGETVKVISKKSYFRFNKLKCEVEMYNSEEELLCKGVIAGMIKGKL